MGNSMMTLVIVLAYLVGILAIIVWTGSRAKKTYQDFALGDHSIPWFVVAGTMFATTVGGGTMIGYVGNYKDLGLQWAWVPLTGFSVGMLLAGFVLSPRLRALDQVTTGDMLGIRYGNGAKMLASGLNCLGEIAVVISMSSSFATMANGYLGINYDFALVAGILIFYTTAVMGGLKGVAWTDAIQAIVIFFTVAIVAVLSFNHLQAAGGLSAVPENLLDPFAQNISWLTMSGNIISCLLMSICMQSLFIQRINATKTANDAKKATLFNAVACGLFMVIGVGIIGISASVTTGPDATGNNVVTAVLAEMPTILGALYAAAIIAAVLTTANSMLLSCSICVVRDFMGVMNPELKSNDKKQLLYSKVIMAVIAVVAALVVKVAPSIMTWILMVYTIIGSLAFPLYYGLLSKKATPLSGVLGVAMGGGVAIVWEALNMFGARPAALADIHAVWFGLAFGILGCMLGKLSSKKSSPEQLAAVDAFARSISYNEALQQIKK